MRASIYPKYATQLEKYVSAYQLVRRVANEYQKSSHRPVTIPVLPRLDFAGPRLEHGPQVPECRMALRGNHRHPFPTQLIYLPACHGQLT